jgi:23S rRNA pseudouridine2605 synthase
MLYYKHMRINRYIAQATGISRRQADKLVQDRKVFINNLPAQLSDHATAVDKVFVNKKQIFLPLETTTIILNKPVGYVCSRDGQGSKTIYELLPDIYKDLKPVGRLDKDSSGLLLLTDDGQLAHELTHPKFVKDKTYLVHLTHPLKGADFDAITKTGVDIGDKIKSKFRLEVRDARHEAGESHTIHDSCYAPDTKDWIVTLHEGRNRQIRRTFSALGYTVKTLHRIRFGDYRLDGLASGSSKKVNLS